MEIEVLSRIRKWFRTTLRQRTDAALFERKVMVQTDEHGISATYPDGTIQSIRWDAVRRVAIETNDSGPWGADVWWLIEGSQAHCTYPGGATGEIEALKALESRLAGFNDERVVQAMGCTSNKRFVCWQRAT
jgi:hypothetical protein